MRSGWLVVPSGGMSTQTGGIIGIGTIADRSRGLKDAYQSSVGMRLAQLYAYNNLKGGEIMKRMKSFLLALVLTGTAGVTVAKAADGVLLKEESTTGSYCHMKFPAIREDSLGTGYHPVLKSADTGDVIDFYGSCDEDPLGKDQWWSQRLQYELEERDAYGQ
jgi:hypothetical protein